MTHASQSLGADPGPEKGWSSFWLVRLMKFIFIGIVWGYLLRPIWWAIREAARYSLVVFVFTFTNTVTFARTRWSWLINGYEPSDDAFGRWVDSRVGEYMNDPWIRIPFCIGALIIGTPLMLVMVLVIGFGIPVAIALTIDQLTYPSHALNERFSHSGPHAGVEMSPEEAAVLVTDAYLYQLEAELASVKNMTIEDWTTLNFNGFWGWTPNDVAGYGILAWPRLFDNRAHRQEGVIYGVRIINQCWSVETSKLGSVDRESADLVAAREDSFSVGATNWWLPSAEANYRNGIDRVRTYQTKLTSGDDSAQTNVTTRNLVRVLDCVYDMLNEPQGRLIDRNATVRWSELDDAVYRAQGAAIVARDFVSALSVAYAKEFERGRLDVQIEQAIDSLNAAAVFNPLFIMRGDGDSMVADHRAKMGRYINEAMERIQDVALAMAS